MRNVEAAQAQALAAIVTGGSFDAAARLLSVTPSAVSQRIRALETAVGRPVISRTRPLRPTEAGLAVVRFARQLELLEADLSAELAASGSEERQRIIVVVNGDSLHTWALPALASVGHALQIEVLREDQEHSLELLRSGTAAAAITSVAAPVQGCSSHPLGVMRYLPVCTRGFQETWFRRGATPEELALAPMILFDRKDDLQDTFLRSRTPLPLSPPRHYVPAAQEFADAIRLGMGWGVIAELELEGRSGGLVTFAAGLHVDVPLYWQQWRRGSSGLVAISDAVRQAADVLRRPGETS